jgi:hypothetical protein
MMPRRFLGMLLFVFGGEVLVGGDDVLSPEIQHLFYQERVKNRFQVFHIKYGLCKF